MITKKSAVGNTATANREQAIIRLV